MVLPEQPGKPAKLILINRFDSSPSVVECSFGPKQADALKSVKPDTVVRFRAKLDRYNQTTIYLKDCELVTGKK